MIAVKKEGILISKTTLNFECEGVLNPAVIREGKYVHVFYRAVALGNYSSIGYCRLDGPLKVDIRSKQPLLIPEHPYEIHGMEDPRIVCIDHLYHLTYTAYDGNNALGALAISEDMVHFKKEGVVAPRITEDAFRTISVLKNMGEQRIQQYSSLAHISASEDQGSFVWNKNIILFPRRIGGKLAFLHRIKPDIQIVTHIQAFSDLTDLFWKDYFLHFAEHIVLVPKFAHEASYVGGGCPPIETRAGWLLIYHGVSGSCGRYVYTACAALLDLDNPQKEIARLPYPLFFPEYQWELIGEVNNVCFPTGAALFDDRLYIYYGAADEQIATASLSLTELLQELEQHKIIV